MIDTGDIRKGITLDIDGKLVKVTEFSQTSRHAIRKYQDDAQGFTHRCQHHHDRHTVPGSPLCG